jgi:SAM-dependent methyltransferase
VNDRGVPADQIDTGRPHPARMYDYWLGGKDNYEVDRAAAERVLATLPRMRDGVRENRAFLRRAVRTVVGSGVRQILDIGTGIPTSPNTHEVAQGLAPDTCVAYVDNDPIVGVHAHARLTDTSGTGFALADLREPKAILTHPVVRALIDFDEPVAVLLVAVLHFIADFEEPARIVATLKQALAPGSWLVITHGTDDTAVHDTSDAVNVYRSATATLNLRPRAQVLDFFDGFELAEPGLVTISEWRPDPGAATPPTRFGIYGGAARKP